MKKIYLLLIAAAVLVAAACGGETTNSPPLNLDVVGHNGGQSAVGSDDTMTFTVTNKSSDIEDLVLIPSNGRDNWYDHHNLTGGDCQLNSDSGWLHCGALKAGAVKLITVQASPRDPGNFQYSIGFGDSPKSGGLRQWDYQKSFTELVV